LFLVEYLKSILILSSMSLMYTKPEGNLLQQTMQKKKNI